MRGDRGNQRQRGAQDPFPFIERVNEDPPPLPPIESASKRGNAVPLSKEDWDSILETNYMPRSPANAKRLMESAEQWRAGQATEGEFGPEE